MFLHKGAVFGKFFLFWVPTFAFIEDEALNKTVPDRAK
jgi:hypothetical protein